MPEGVAKTQLANSAALALMFLHISSDWHGGTEKFNKKLFLLKPPLDQRMFVISMECYNVFI